MKYSIAKMKALEFFKEKNHQIKIAKSNKKEDYCLLFNDEEPTNNFKVIEIINSESIKK